MIPLFEHSFYFMRHGRTDANARDIVCGQLDLPLDEEGRAQATRSAARLMDYPIAAIWCSPLKRARATAEAAAAVLNLEIREVPDLMERDWGKLDGTDRADLDRDATPPGGESPEDFRTRTLRGLGQVEGPHPVLIVAHAGTSRVIQGELTGGDFDRPLNTEVRHWIKDEDRWTCRTLIPGS